MTLNLTNGGGQWVEYDPALGGGATALQLRRRRADVYHFTAARTGAVAGSLVANDNGYTLTLGVKSGTGTVLLVGRTATIR